MQPEFKAAIELGNHLLKTLGETESHILTVLKAIRTDQYSSIKHERE